MGVQDASMQKKKKKKTTAPFTFLHEWAHTAELLLSFVCHALLASGQVSPKGYSFHSQLQMESQTIARPPLPIQKADERESCVKEIHFGTFNRHSAGRPVDGCHLIHLLAEEPPQTPSPLRFGPRQFATLVM